jgi:hypothetical protein
MASRWLGNSKKSKEVISKMPKMNKISIVLSIFLLLVSVTSALSEIPSFGASNYPEFANDLKTLKSIEVVARNGVLIFGKASLEKKDYIRVLRLKGAPFEMGYQRGILLKKEITHILKNRTKVESYFSFSRKSKTLKYLRHIEPKIPSEYIDEVKGMAAALDINFDYMLAAVLQWELDRLGCTIVAANNGATLDGKMLSLRSMENSPDWHTFLEILVIFYEPDRGNSFASLNGPGGIGVYTGINDKQLTVDDNLLRCLKVDFSGDGIPLTLFKRMVIQYSNILEDVHRFVEGHKRSSPINIFVADGKLNEMRVYELGTDRFAVRRPENNILCSMNHTVALDAELKYRPEESYARYNFAMEYMKKAYGEISLEKLINFTKTDFIADKRKRVLQYIVINSPKELDFWVAVQKEDNKQACYNEFIKFNLLEEIKR